MMTMKTPLPEIRSINRSPYQPALDLSVSSNLYLTDQQGQWFEDVMDDPEYRETVSSALDGGEDALFRLLAKTRLRGAHRRITVVDCGPASIQESIRKLQKLMRTVTVAEYVVIDMNAHLLSKIQSRVAGTLGVPTRFIQSRFEDLTHESLADSAAEETLLLFGSTEMNYEPDELVDVLHKFCLPGTLLAFEGLLRTIDGSTTGYKSAAVARFAFGPLFLLGAHQEQFDFAPVFLGDRIVLEFIANQTMEFQSEGYPSLKCGDAVWTAFSRRPTLEQHKASFALIADPIDTLVLEPRIASSLGRFR